MQWRRLSCAGLVCLPTLLLVSSVFSCLIQYFVRIVIPILIMSRLRFNCSSPNSWNLLFKIILVLVVSCELTDLLNYGVDL